MAEWSMAAVLKTVERQRSGGSNPSSSAKSQLNAGFSRRQRDKSHPRYPLPNPSPRERGYCRFAPNLTIAPRQRGGMSEGDVPARRLTPPSISSSKPNASPAQRGGMSEGEVRPPSLRDRLYYVCHRMNGGIVRAILWHPIGLEGPKCCHRMNERAVLCILWQGGILHENCSKSSI